MLSWFRGAPAASNTQKPAEPSESTQAQPPAEDVQRLDGDETLPEQDPAPLFAVKAFRTAVFGTPAPKARPRNTAGHAARKPSDSQKTDSTQATQKHDEKTATTTSAFPRQRDGRTAETRRADAKEALEKRREARTRLTSFKKDDNGEKPQFKLSAKPNLFDPSAPKTFDLPPSLTEVRPPSPTKSILVAPGSARRKKAVNFHHSVITPPKNPRIRSELPNDCPGKFPSPWTPRVGAPAGSNKRSASSGSLEETSKPLQSANKKSRQGYGLFIDDESRIEDLLKDNDKDETDVTTDMNAPRSTSGKYWKEHAENLEELAVNRVEKLKERCNTAIEYAKRKDEVCASLGERLREFMDKNQKLKDEIRRLHAGGEPSAGVDAGLLEDALKVITEKETKLDAAEKEIQRMQAMVEEYANKVKTFEGMLDSREDKITELSMTMLNGDNDNLSSAAEVRDLRQKLRKAKQEIRKLEQEKANLKFSSGQDINSSMLVPRSDVEVALRAEIAELEKAKQQLRSELRQRTTEVSRERREAEKAFRSEIVELKSKLAMEQLEKKELAREKDRLNEQLSSGGGAGVGDRTADEWQQKHRQTLQELRQVKEELAALQAERNIRTLSRSRGPTEQSTIQQGLTVKEGSASDDSAIDRTFDRTARRNSKVSIREKPQEAVPESSVFDLPDPLPMFNRSTGSVFTNDLPDISALPSEPPNPNTPSRIAGNETSFAAARREKASPRPSIVNWNVSPVVKRKAVAVRKPTTSRALDGMDPARKAAAEKRIAERRAARKAVQAA